MKILYDGAAFGMQERGGVSRVMFELFRHVSVLPESDCILFAGFHCNTYLQEAEPSVRKKIIGWRIPSWLLKQRIFMPLNGFLFSCIAYIFKPDICHYTYFHTPSVPRACKTVVTVHDLIEELFYSGRAVWKYVIKKTALDKVDGVISISSNTKNDLNRLYDVADKKQAVIYHGNSFAGITPKAVENPFDYYLYVGSRTADYKNFDLVLQSMVPLLNNHMRLVCFGGGEFTAAEIARAQVLGVREFLEYAGGNDETLAGYYKQAVCLIYPSKYEGFGLPPIEAMSLGCPVVTSNAPPMPEIIEYAGLYFNPDSAEDLMRCLNEIADQSVREQYVKGGIEHANNFSWQCASERARSFYSELMNS